MTPAYLRHLEDTLSSIRAAGLYKEERPLAGRQSSHIRLADGREVLNFCANNYLGLSDHPDLIAAARASYDAWGYGLSSVRFICGTQTLHQSLEQEISAFLGTEDTILYGSCFDANGGLFETLLGPEDAVISDELNHASIIDGIRLCKAKRFRYRNCDLADLEAKLVEAASCRFKLIATDGVFSMDGHIAPLNRIADLAERHGALLMVDDSHAVGFLGANGRGTHEHCGALGRVDILTGTLGKALGGASGGYTSGKREVISLLRQRSRPYLFSNTLAPAIAAASRVGIELAQRDHARRERLWSNTRRFRAGLTEAGLNVLPGEHPIVPVMLGEAELAQEFSRRLLAHGIFAVGFFYPVVPQGQARIRTQISAAHSPEDIETALAAFAAVGAELGVLRAG
jgi:glycine C-acetyltransferase